MDTQESWATLDSGTGLNHEAQAANVIAASRSGPRRPDRQQPTTDAPHS